jgi:hypothetical protein
MQILPSGGVESDGVMVPAPGVFVSNLLYDEKSTTAASRLTSVSFDDLSGVVVTLGCFNMAGVTSFSCPSLKCVGGGFTLTALPLAVSVNFDSLVMVGGNFAIGTMASLTTLSFPALKGVSGNFTPATMASLTTLSFPALKGVAGTVQPATMASLTTLSFPALEDVGVNFVVSSMASLTTISAPAMVAYGGTVTLNSALGNVTSLILGTIGTLKIVMGATINVSGQKLDVTSVNALLALLVSLDGTNGTTLWGSGKTLTINGGTNAAPTGQGITDKTTLQARGATITTN